MRVWLGIGTRKVCVTVIVQPFMWRWALDGGLGLLREIYVGPVTFQFWRR